MVHFGVFMRFLLCTVTLHLSATLVSTSGEGQPRVIGAHQPVVAILGDDVILPCHLEPSYNVEGLTVEWSKPDLKPDPSDRLSRVNYVHLYRDRREVPDMKIKSYEMRTELFTENLKHGNISLKIMNVTLEDQGRYKCFIPKLKSNVKASVVQLIVEPESVKTTKLAAPVTPRNVPNPDPNNEAKYVRCRLAVLIPVVLFILVVGVGVGCLYKHKSNGVDQGKLFPV